MNDLPPCPHRGREVEPGQIECSSNRFAGPDFAIRPVKICLTPCPFANEPNRVKKSRGLGDLLAKCLGWLGVKKKQGCGCGQRQNKLNKWFPFGEK